MLCCAALLIVFYTLCLITCVPSIRVMVPLKWLPNNDSQLGVFPERINSCFLIFKKIKNTLVNSPPKSLSVSRCFFLPHCVEKSKLMSVCGFSPPNESSDIRFDWSGPPEQRETTCRSRNQHTNRPSAQYYHIHIYSCPHPPSLHPPTYSHVPLPFQNSLSVLKVYS